MKRDKNIKQMTLEFEQTEDSHLTAEQIAELDEALKQRVDAAFRKGMCLFSIMLILLNFIF